MSDTATEAEALLAKARAGAAGENANPPTWKPEPGEELIGTLEKADYVGTRNGPAHLMQIKILDTEDVVTVWCSQMVLKNQVLDLAPAEGAVVVIIFEGKKDNKEGTRQYNSYQMQASESDFELWSRVTREGAEKIKLKAEIAGPSAGSGVVDEDDLEAPY